MIILGNGEQGPCGPCSEIHIDLRDQSEKDKVPAIDLINKSDPLVIELWEPRIYSIQQKG